MIGLLVLFAGVVRVAAYAALMTDVYPPFRLDLGGGRTADRNRGRDRSHDARPGALVTADLERSATVATDADSSARPSK